MPAARSVRYGKAALFAVLLLVALVLILLVVALVLIVAFVLITVVLVVLTVVVLHEMTSFRPIGYRCILDSNTGKYSFQHHFNKNEKTVDKAFGGWYTKSANKEG